MLDWSQEDLADAACVSISTIRTMELGKIPRSRTLQDICKTFEDNGLEFIDDEGVRKRALGVNVIRGEDSCNALFEDIIETLDIMNGDVLVLTKDETVLTQRCGSDFQSNLDRLQAIQNKHEVKCLLSGITNPSFSKPSFSCRAVPHRSCGMTSVFIYGDKYALVYPKNTYEFTVVLFDKACATKVSRAEFVSLWNDGALVNF